MSYLCYKLDEASREKLIGLFPPKYPMVRYDHVTISTTDLNLKTIKPTDSVEIIGIADDGNGIEAFIVKVNQSIRRPDGKIWHITASFDPNKLAPAEFDIFSPREKRQEKPYKPATSNGFLAQLITENGEINPKLSPNWSVSFFKEPIKINAYPKLQLNREELEKINAHTITL